MVMICGCGTGKTGNNYCQPIPPFKKSPMRLVWYIPLHRKGSFCMTHLDKKGSLQMERQTSLNVLCFVL